MENLIDLLADFGVWNWFLLACALFMLEFIIPGVHFLWFGLAAVIAGILMMILASAAPEFANSLTLPYQLIIYALISTATVFAVRHYAIGSATVVDEPHLNARSAQYVGRMAVVEVPITGGRGKVRIGDTLWLAKGPDAVSGTRVRITGFDGTVLLVEAEAES